MQTVSFRGGLVAVASLGCALMTASARVWAAAEEHGAGGGEHGGGGVPLEPAPDLALWSLVVFVIFLLVLKRFAWGPLSEALNKREARIRQDLLDAEAARLKSERMLAEHREQLEKVEDQVREILAEARRDAEHTKNEIVSEAQREARATQKRAIDAIDRAREQALKDLFDVLSHNVAEATEHVLGRALTSEDRERLIDDALAELAGPAH